MTGGTAAVTAQEFQHSEGTEDWRTLGSRVSTWFGAPSHTAGAALARRLAELDLPMDLSVRATGVRVDLATGGRDLTTSDVAVARTVSAEAAALGLTGDLAVVQTLRLTFDVRDRAAVPPFWTTVLGYVPAGADGIADPVRRSPQIQFQDQQDQRPLRNRLHLDAVTPHPVARAALETVRERGAGAIADHGFYATVADLEGNEVDLLPLQDGADRWGEPETDDWRLVFSAIACYPTDSSQSAARLAHAVAELADKAGLPLGIDLRPGLVVLDTGKDLWEQDSGYQVLAARIQHTARALEFTADVTHPRFSRRASTPRTSRRCDGSGVRFSGTRRTRGRGSPTSSIRASSPCRCSSNRSAPRRPSGSLSPTGSISTRSRPGAGPGGSGPCRRWIAGLRRACTPQLDAGRPGGQRGRHQRGPRARRGRPGRSSQD